MIAALQNEENYPEVCQDILSYMKERWPHHLTYHSLSHIIDVANVCDAHIRHYSIDKDNADLIRIAAISHDIGYLVSPVNHEEIGIKEIKPFLEKSHNKRQIATINGMIRSTKVPQRPHTFYDEILADADLDYLGREDYDVLSHELYKEFLYYNVVETDEQWLRTQINFLENHKYHTSFSKDKRSISKIKKLKELKSKLCP